MEQNPKQEDDTISHLQKGTQQLKILVIVVSVVVLVSGLVWYLLKNKSVVIKSPQTNYNKSTMATEENQMIPTILSVSPLSVRAGEVVRITGTGFSKLNMVNMNRGDNFLRFPVDSSDGTTLEFTIPLESNNILPLPSVGSKNVNLPPPIVPTQGAYHITIDNQIVGSESNSFDITIQSLQ
jgi:hypothetical protein